MKHLRIATRNSLLALKQTEMVKCQLEQFHSDLQIETVGLTTEGDRKLSTSLAKIGGKGLFIKELEHALQEGEADIAVHSMKDVPAQMPEGFILSTILKRGDPRDAFVSNDYSNLDELPSGAVVGTSSLRRQYELNALRPDLNVAVLRGNVQTRLRKLDEGQFSAILLAAAGLQRLNLEQRITAYLSVEEFVPAVGQGAIGIECCEIDHETQDLVDPLSDEETTICLQAERAVSEALNADCHTPLGAYAQVVNGEFSLRGFYANEETGQYKTAYLIGSVTEPQALGRAMAERLLV